MRSAHWFRWVRFSALCLAVVATSCRDEQAGPKPKAPRGPAAVANPNPTGGNVQTLDALPGPLTFQSGATWNGGAVTYLGSLLVPEKPTPGQNVVLKHYFRADGAVEGQWRFFLHVLDDGTKQQVGNLDHELQQGAAPLGTWPRGKIIEDTHGFQMPNFQGSLRLMLGFWNDRGRLPVDSVALSDGQGRVTGPKIEGPQASLPEYTTVRAAKPPEIDGKLDDPVWASAKEVTLTRSFDGGPTTRKTTFRILWDDTNLYVAFRAEDTDLWGTLLKKDDPIYNEDVCEVFFDADADGKTYNELQVSPHNVNFDASFVARRSDLAEAMKWESGMTTAVFLKGTIDDDKDTDEFWSAEMKIPIANLTAVPHVPPQKGDRWRFNAYRLEHLARRTNVEGQSFSPLFIGDFHALPRFGWLVFE
ncbi:MAG: carbohydrate-binding family 9-like protein [Myxococcaceae bacterium]